MAKDYWGLLVGADKPRIVIDWGQENGCALSLNTFSRLTHYVSVLLSLIN